jgi:hypothetical protein
VARGIDAGGGRLVSEAEGDVVVEVKVLVVKRIRVRYRLSARPVDKREAAERAHSFHAGRRLVARSIGGSIEITTELDFAD